MSNLIRRLKPGSRLTISNLRSPYRAQKMSKRGGDGTSRYFLDIQLTNAVRIRCWRSPDEEIDEASATMFDLLDGLDAVAEAFDRLVELGEPIPDELIEFGQTAKQMAQAGRRLAATCKPVDGSRGRRVAPHGSLGPSKSA
jgi:hypothetical protein